MGAPDNLFSLSYLSLPKSQCFIVLSLYLVLLTKTFFLLSRRHKRFPLKGSHSLYTTLVSNQKGALVLTVHFITQSVASGALLPPQDRQNLLNCVVLCSCVDGSEAALPLSGIIPPPPIIFPPDTLQSELCDAGLRGSFLTLVDLGRGGGEEINPSVATVV